jgi:mannose-6-phosphate isomerase-like protein (cupin superfamily)
MLRRMNTRNWKMTLAGACVACAFGLIAWRLAWATPGSGVTRTPIAGPVLLGEVDTKSEFADHEVEFSTKGLSDVYVTSIKIVPGGTSGWHSHLGPSIFSVTAGTLTVYDDCDDFRTGHDFAAGTALVVDAACVYTIVNEGDADLAFTVVQIIPFGEPRVIDEPAP